MSKNFSWASESWKALKILALFSLLTGVLYPLAITWLGQTFFPYQANGSLFEKDGKVMGSVLIGQAFSKEYYFFSRPSAVNYDASASGASNLGPASKKLSKAVQENIEKIRAINGLNKNEKIPADLALASGSGLDPHISVSSAIVQAPRIARLSKMSENEVLKLVADNKEGKQFGLLGQERVNVLKLNRALDAKMKSLRDKK
jgi:K+-transporting ATPase ATPase C chain